MGWGELLWWRISEAGANNGLMMLELKGHTDVDRLRQSLEKLSMVHPLLRARGVRDGQGARFEVMNHPVAALRVVERRDDKHWIEVLEQETNEPVSADALPLWRFVAVVGPDRAEWIANFNHAIADGVSAIMFLDQLLRIYAGEPPMPARSLAPAFDGITKHGGAMALLKYTWRYLSGMVGRPPVAMLPLAKGVEPYSPGRTRIAEFTLDEATTAALSKHCKAHRVSLNALISAALLTASSEHIEGAAPHRIGMSFAMNLRPLLDVNVNDDFGYYVTGSEADHVVSPGGDLWELARQTMKDSSRVYHGEHVKVNSWLRQVILKLKPTGQSLLDSAPKGSKACFHITNMGRLDKPTQYGDMQVLRWFHAAMVHLVRRPFLCLCCVAYAGRLQLTFGYCEPHTDKAMVDQLLGRFLGILQQAAKG